MPVPVTPQKSKDVSSPPTPLDSSKHSGGPLQSNEDPCVVAGYEDCLQETIRFLVQDEQLPSEHPLVAGLNVHLRSGMAHQELLRLSQYLADKLNDDLHPGVIRQDEMDSEVDSSFFAKHEGPYTQTYELTLEEDTSDLEDEDGSIEQDISDYKENIITGKDILADPFLRNALIRFVFQGCDLVVASVPPQ